jgi:hypothetical protein
MPIPFDTEVVNQTHAIYNGNTYYRHISIDICDRIRKNETIVRSISNELESLFRMVRAIRRVITLRLV